MTDNILIIIAFIVYLSLMMLIGIYYYRRTRNMADYILGNRKLGAWVTSLSAEASDMSGWMLMGLPGFAYLAGLNAGWIALGLALGTYFNWKFVAERLRKYTELANNSLTIPDFLQNRYQDRSNLLRVIPAVFILIFFIIYTSSGFVAGGKLFETIFGIPYEAAVLLGAFVVVFYTLAGGFLAVSMTDFIQGVMMFFAILLVPFAGMMLLGGPVTSLESLYLVEPTFFNPFIKPDGSMLGFIEFLSLMGWGLGYFGQPHILVRFMAIRSSKELTSAMHIAMTWVVISLSAAVLVGLVGHIFLVPALSGSDSETVFLRMTHDIFSPFAAGLILSAVLAAIMSTASAQLLVAASAFAQDFYRSIFRSTAEQKELLWVSRISVLCIAGFAITIAMNPSSLILDMVAYAWAGFGATFGPALLMSLFWRRATRNGVLAGIIVGGITVLIWKQFAFFGLYELVPGFLFALLTIYIISRLDTPPAEEITSTFDAVEKSDI
ncbi:sodium/proline symporter PutP [Selenomonas sp. TAMA-11512]|uniref:sodium/proline symporter PutP n=1 Tax=Selenomonas sp. TAMA-11512 TaxID=3095337 RepID=UPI00308B4A05|nr:sodium/proline symporter PutP [Selenomonas sp. TAMA-11512]